MALKLHDASQARQLRAQAAEEYAAALVKLIEHERVRGLHRRYITRLEFEYQLAAGEMLHVLPDGVVVFDSNGEEIKC